MKQSIVVAVDECEHSLAAFETAVNLLTKDTELVLLHVLEIQQTSIFDPLHEPLDKIWNYEQREKAKGIEMKFKEMCQEKGITQFRYIDIESTDARGAICDQLEKLEPKPLCLVMGSRGLGTVKSLLLGSVSSHCSLYAPCSVYIVKKQET